VRRFTLSPDAVAFPMPSRDELLGRIPKRHPRLFVRPEDVPRLRRLARTERKKDFEALVAFCERALRNPPPSEEPPKYPPDVERKDERWLKIWWGNRTYTIRLLNTAAQLAFTRLLGGKEEYGQLARRLLLAAAKWDPKGSTGYRYNDEAGMPYNYYFSRTYTFVHDLLSEEERDLCRRVMAVRGKEMYDHLCPRHLWRPYASHSNRAWHFLGEISIAFHGEIPEADDWVWFAANVFFCVYPVWCDDDGGWHEGICYWNSYITRFTWWADVMRAAFGISAYRKPYFSQVGYYPMYLTPPGTRGGGFGDLCGRWTSRHNARLVAVLAAQARNPHWRWYVEANGNPPPEGGYIGFVRGTLPEVEPKPPDDLPTSRCFRGIGQAVLNTNLEDARENVEVVFKSSPFGTQSHGYEANNAFLLYAFGERLLIRSGRRDIYGSAHHKSWMWHTKSVNCITVNGEGQRKHSAAAQGEILAFHTSRHLDFVSGEAASAYQGRLKRFTRSIIFLKPHLLVIYDRLEAPKPSTFQWWLHSPTEMKVGGQRDVRVVNGGAACKVEFLQPQGLRLGLTNKFDPPPRPRVRLVEWHLTASTPRPATTQEFVTAIWPHRSPGKPAGQARLRRVENGYVLEASLPDGRAVVLLRNRDSGEVAGGGLRAAADVAAFRFDRQGRQAAAIEVSGRKVSAR